MVAVNRRHTVVDLDFDGVAAIVDEEDDGVLSEPHRRGDVLCRHLRGRTPMVCLLIKDRRRKLRLHTRSESVARNDLATCQSESAGTAWVQVSPRTEDCANWSCMGTSCDDCLSERPQ